MPVTVLQLIYTVHQVVYSAAARTIRKLSFGNHSARDEFGIAGFCGRRHFCELRPLASDLCGQLVTADFFEGR
jgi:hypothetical protein